MSSFSPFADDAASITIGKLTIENGTDRIAFYGSLELTHDKQGLTSAKALKAIVDEAVELLSSRTDLPDSVGPDVPGKTVRNPFAA